MKRWNAWLVTMSGLCAKWKKVWRRSTAEKCLNTMKLQLEWKSSSPKNNAVANASPLDHRCRKGPGKHRRLHLRKDAGKRRTPDTRDLRCGFRAENLSKPRPPRQEIRNTRTGAPRTSIYRRLQGRGRCSRHCSHSARRPTVAAMKQGIGRIGLYSSCEEHNCPCIPTSLCTVCA